MANFWVHFCYRTAEICTKMEICIFPVFCSKSCSAKGRFLYKTRARITFSTDFAFRGRSVAKLGWNLLLAAVLLRFRGKDPFWVSWACWGSFWSFFFGNYSVLGIWGSDCVHFMRVLKQFSPFWYFLGGCRKPKNRGRPN